MEAKARRVARQRRREQGATMLEFALIAPVLLLLVMAIIDASCMLWVHLTLEHALREGGRFALTMRTDHDPRLARHEQILQAVRKNAFGLFDRVNPKLTIKVNDGAPVIYPNPKSYTNGMFGQEQDRVQWTLDASWPLMTPLMQPFFTNGKYHFRVTTLFTNETKP